MPKELLTIQNARKVYQAKDYKGVKHETIALSDINLTIYAGETLGLVGESGSGKSTLGKAVLGFERLTSGEIIRHNATFTSNQKNMQIIFQDPYSSLNPRMSALELVMEPIMAQMTKTEAMEKALAILAIVGIQGDDVYKRPSQFSGGQRQRIGIARAVVCQPNFIVCDEPTSALDVSIQAQILDLLKRLQETYHMTYLFISHDLAVVKHITDRIAVMYKGHLVELAHTNQIFANPQHPYTKKLLAASPKLNISEAKQQLKQFTLYDDHLFAFSDTDQWVEIENNHFVRLAH